MTKIDCNIKPQIRIKPFNHDETDSVINLMDLGPATIDLTKKIPQKEIIEILKKVGVLKENSFVFPSRYSIKFLPKFEDVVVNNLSKTNDTTVIAKDGSVRHCGSWHDKEIAPEGTYPEIVEDVKGYIEEPKFLYYDPRKFTPKPDKK